MLFPPYSEEKLKDEEFYQKILKRWQRRKELNWTDFAGMPSKQQYWWTLMKRLETTLKDSSIKLEKELFKKYYRLLLEIKFFFLEQLEDKEVLELFRNHFIFGLKLSSFDIRNRLHAKVQRKFYGQDRDAFLKKLRQELKENKELVGQREIKVQNEEVKPFLKNWLKDYELFLGSGMHNTLEITNYFFKNSNVRLLSPEERKLLRKIIEFYEVLKMPFNYPGSLSSAPLYVYGLEARGTGIRRRYMVSDSRVKAFLEKEREKRTLKRKKTREEKEAELKILSKVKESKVKGKKILKRKRIPSVSGKEVEGVIKKSILSGKKPIPAESIAKLSSSEGLQKLDIEDFRRYNPDPKESAKFMLNRIRKLISSSPANREKIRETFRKSSLFRLYLSHKKEISDTQKTIKQVIESRKATGRPWVSEEEYRILSILERTI